MMYLVINKKLLTNFVYSLIITMFPLPITIFSNHKNMYIFTKSNQSINLKNFKKKQASNYSSHFIGLNIINILFS